MEISREELMRREAVRGGSFLLSHRVDLLGIATSILKMRESGFTGQGAVPPVEAAVLSCYMVAREQLTLMMEQQGRQNISAEGQAGILRNLMRDVLGEFLMDAQIEVAD